MQRVRFLVFCVKYLRKLTPPDKPFRPQELSPESDYSNPRSASPLSPPSRSPFKMNRSVTTPVPRRRPGPPSPKMTGNLDCAFPPFPSKRSATPQSAKPQSRERLEPRTQHLHAEPSPLFAPLSPRFDGGDNISKRMDNIAPGPFDGRADRRPSTSNTSKSPTFEGASLGHRRTGTQESARSIGDATTKHRRSVSSTASRVSTYSARSVGLPARPKPGMRAATTTPPPPLPSAPEQSEGIDAFLDRLQKESKRPSQVRAVTEPNPEVSRQGSLEKKEPPTRPRRPSSKDLPNNEERELQPSAFDTLPKTFFPKRKQSLGGIKLASDWDVVQARSLQQPPPPLLPPTFTHDAPMNPLHTPSDSGMSDDSYASFGYRSVASSRSSPPGSETGHSREPSKLGQSTHMDTSVERTTSPDSYVQMRTASPHERKMKAPEIQASPVAALSPPQPLSPDYSDAPESPMDPAIQMGLSFAPRPKEISPRQAPASNAGPPPRRPSPEAAPRRPSPEVAPRRQETRPASKGKCRGCSEPIVGKSVKDSSGRITGRYHKQCFTCRTCSDPFPTAEFYVFNNSPYCERHYHELNGSICGGCNRGIEGQYLEVDGRRKFHPRCFTCSTCRVVLRDDYYEVAGQKYCDRHARSAANPPQNYLGPAGYRPRMEKRRTRLMMMA
jgi:hypothetical protein